ncbi:tyrosine-type recombinase/integrase [Streptococcus thoraltensis]|uniref:tyrosine-type recombinase/integrase n=1 Tax=Streptococcus thoraltensis TaxID=55085 RepID=UPI001F55E6B7|nr:site-specific integrase [Streptococcus thoraltensis]
MTITKTKNNTFHLKMYVPIEARAALNIKGTHFEKRYKTRKEAKKAEIELLTKLQNIENGEEIPEQNGDILFSEFYKKVWLIPYKAGQTTSTTRPPSEITAARTEEVFRLHILPMFGNYTLDFLNSNKQVVLNLMTAKAEEYANFKVIRSYVNSIFDWAEELEYIEYNRLAKTIRRTKATKKLRLEENRNDEDHYLTQHELRLWFEAFQEDLANEKISLKDYTLFFTTFFLSDRKSESYALQWKHIDLHNGTIQLVQALDQKGNTKKTKGRKKTLFSIPNELITILDRWKKQQRKESSKFNILQTPEQYLFTYIDTKGNVNKPVHTDYLNNKMRSVENRHKLRHATPHMLRHTGATLAKQAGTSLEVISEALTHSDTATTKTYINTSNVVPIAMGELVYRNLGK